MRPLLFRVDLLWHATMVHACLADLGGEASIDLATFTLEVRARNRYYRFYPRFQAFEGEQVRYVEQPVDEMRGFAGWLPYSNKRWPIGSGKFAFKDFCREHGLPTPRMWRNAEASMRDFLIKHDQSSSGRGMRGPFAVYDPAATPHAAQDGGYYEQFIRGSMIKAWYWEDRLVVFETFPIPTLAGDGKSSVRELITRASRIKPSNWEKIEDIARYQGLTLDAVPAEGQRFMIEFRYASSLVRMEPGGSTPEQCKDSPLFEPLMRIGPVLWQGIPEEIRAATIYTVDAVADADGKVWLLEMNCNPGIHPETYPFMLERLFGPRGAVKAEALASLAPEPPATALPLPARMAQRQPMPGMQPPPGAIRTRWIS